MMRTDSELRLMDWFCGAGGSSQGAHAVPGVRVSLAANHWAKAIESHSINFPSTSHYKGDIREAPVEKWPAADIFWASPECPKWSNARGKKRNFDRTAQGELDFGDVTDGERATREEEERSRALMEEVPQYLRGVQDRGGLVLAGVVENVIDVRGWDQWDRWHREIKALGYRTRLIAMNSMHADPRTLHRAPQSRDRLYLAYWHNSLGRDPDWDKWLRPPAWCPKCGEQVQALQVFKNPAKDMGRYRQSYVYRCPRSTCRTILEPNALPASVAIDWSIPGTRIGDRPRTEDAPEGLAPATIARIRAGLARYAMPLGDQAGKRPTEPAEATLFGDVEPVEQPAGNPVPMLVPAGGTWRDRATSVEVPMPTRNTVETDGLAVPPLLVPVEGRDGKNAAPVERPLRTQTARNETGLAWLPFVVPMRGGGDKERARDIDEPLHAVTAGGNHHGLVTPPCSEHLLVPYYGNGTARSVHDPIGALTTRDRYALVRGDVSIDDVLFRMLEPHEIGRAMSFADAYQVVGNKRQRVRQYGNAVTPNVAEILVCALVEAITGTEISRHEQELAA